MQLSLKGKKSHY